MTGVTQIAEEFHTKTEAWDLKAYVLGALFYRFVSEDMVAFINRQESAAGATGFDYAALDDSRAVKGRDLTIAEKGYFLLPSQLFCAVQANAEHDADLNETLSDAFSAIYTSAKGTPSERAYIGLFNNFNPNSELLGDTVARRNRRLAKLLNDIGKYPMSDAAGDFGELLRYYVTTAGKKGGDHFTPPSIAQLVARLATVTNPKARTIYDPAFGSGSLLIKSRGYLATDARLYGQELVLTNYNMARMNLLLHGVEFDRLDLSGGESTLTDPAHGDDQPFDIVVSNPKWSTRWVGDDDALLINDVRFAPASVLAPKKYHDLAFTMHAASWLAPSGVAVIVQFPGTLYRGGTEAKIREYLVRNNLIDTVIQLPPDWGYGVTVPGVILLLRKSKSDNAVLFVDASKQCKRVGNKNELGEDHQKTILQAVTNRVDVEHFAHLVANEDIALERFDLSVSKYVTRKDDRLPVDIRVLNDEIAQIVSHQSELRREIDAIVADLEGAEA